MVVWPPGVRLDRRQALSGEADRRKGRVKLAVETSRCGHRRMILSPPKTSPPFLGLRVVILKYVTFYVYPQNLTRGVACNRLLRMEPPLLPLVITVTGHRELHPDDVPRLESQLRIFFGELMAKYPDTPLLLMSAMGPGADLLAARVATEMRGIELVAVLPWPPGVCDEYSHRGGDRAAFETLLAQASRTICLPLPDGITEPRLAESADDRESCFATVGRYLTRQCEALLAIWDGGESENSQTWQMICWHREGADAPFASSGTHLDEPETGPAWHLPARRGTEAPPLEKTEVVVEPSESLLNTFEEIARNFDRFNRDVTVHEDRLAEGRKQSKGYLFPISEQTSLPPHLGFLLERFAIADQLAIWWQRASYWVLIAILGLIFLSVTLFECYAHVDPSQLGLLVGYLLFFCFGWLVVWQTRRWRNYNRYLDFRALAEAMRVHLFWKLAGLHENASDYYLRSCRSQLDWIRSALRAWTVQSGEHDCRCACPVDLPPDAATLCQVRNRWMADQQKFFAKNQKRDHHKAHLCHLWARGFLCISLAATAVQLGRLLWVGGHVGHDGLTHALIMVIAMGGVLAGLCHEYMEKRLFEKQSRSYAWMASLYQTALTRFDPLLERNENGQIQSLVLELGREALAENADWVIYHREREPEMKGH